MTEKELVAAEAKALGLAIKDHNTFTFIVNIAYQDIEDEIDDLWLIGARPEGDFTTRFKKFVSIAIKENYNSNAAGIVSIQAELDTAAELSIPVEWILEITK